jgi:fermentation-respiration switch protein FrsA (DUF1100 family)
MNTIRTGILMAIMLCGMAFALAAQAEPGGTKTPTLAGAWLGTLKVPMAELRVVFNITANPDGSLSATLDSPDQGATGVPITSISFANGQLTLESKPIQGRYEGTLSADGSTMDGKWTQAGISLDLPMKRVTEAPKPMRPQEPKKPYPYIDEEVTYQNAKAGIILAGTLTMPRTGSPFPAVLLITGSGSQDRDETVFGHRPFLVLADFLTRRGIAVLRVDDRGMGGSKGDTSQATSEDSAQDVSAGIEFLKTRKEIDAKRIGLIGHSEGGIIAPMVAVKSADVSFIVLMAGTGVTGDRIIEGQIARLLTVAGADQALIDSTIRAQRRVCEVVQRETNPELLKQEVRKVIADTVSKLDETQKQAIGYSDAFVDMQVTAATSTWFRFFIMHDPTTVLRKVKCPVLAINGELDMQVPAQENLSAIEGALREGGNADFTVRELPGLNHLFQTAKTGAVDEYARIEETMSPRALETIAQWIQSRLTRK